MRLEKKSVLYFKEGNSDKVYEIDLCNVGIEKYVVNFRYGRRGSQLKEGTKTPIPVSLSEAEKIFDTVETEKLTKGYTTSDSGISEIPKSAPFNLDDKIIVYSSDWANFPAGRTKAILQRLQQTAQGNSATAKTHWKTSRVIWKAGEYKIKEATPYLIKLFNTADVLQQYSCVWALARCGGNGAIEALQSLYASHSSAYIKKIAGAGLLIQLSTLDKETHVQHYLNKLPEAIKQAVNNEDAIAFNNLIYERIAQEQPHFNWLEDLYLLSINKKWIRSSLKNLLLGLPLRPNYFKHVRSIFKLAELLDDYEMSGLLSYRFEREVEMFTHQLSKEMRMESEDVFIEELGEFVDLSKEFKKKTARIAYSQKTRWYLHRRTRRRLAMLGHNNDTDYVKLATSLLVAYDRKKDFAAGYSTHRYEYVNNRYQQVETKFPQNATSVYMHLVLGNDQEKLELTGNGSLWRIQSGNRKEQNKSATPTQQSGGLLKFLSGLFGKKKETSQTPQAPVQSNISNESGTPFLHLWNQMPQAYVQLLMQAQMEEVHEFAERELTRHEQFNQIKEKLDKQACKQLLLSPFSIPANFGFAITKEKYTGTLPDEDLVVALLNSIISDARNQGKQWTETYASTYIQQSNFISALLFARDAEIRNWGKSFLQKNPIEPLVKQAVAGKAVATLIDFEASTADNEAIIKEATDTLFELLPAELKEINLSVVSDLLEHDNAAVLLFGLRLLKSKKQQLNLEELSDNFITQLLQHNYAPVREAGIDFLQGMSDTSLLRRQDLIISQYLSPFANVRDGLAFIIGRMAKAEKLFGDKAAETLMPYLLRKESQEGIHKNISNLLCNELSNHLQNANKETALNLLYSNYSAAQDVGVVILEKYTDPSQLTLPQVIALGAHENLNVRAWSWKFYKEQVPRIRYEKEGAIKLLESKWQDTRQFAMLYFGETFMENDWNPETLITLADSVKPDVEAFGRELITRYFSAEHGVDYLLKLSQHPSEKMQLFATNYLTRFAKDDLSKIEALEFYFRSVLTRVNKSRIAKNRIYQFLLEEGRKSEQGANIVSRIISQISAIAAIGDKAKCIEILLQLNSLYKLEIPLRVRDWKERV